jgi:hypothetical protein
MQDCVKESATITAGLRLGLEEGQNNAQPWLMTSSGSPLSKEYEETQG